MACRFGLSNLGNRRRVVCIISTLNNFPIDTPSKKFDNRVSEYIIICQSEN